MAGAGGDHTCPSVTAQAARRRQLHTVCANGRGQMHFLPEQKTTQREATEQVSKETAVSHRDDKRSTLEQLKLQDNKDQGSHRGYPGYSLYFNRTIFEQIKLLYIV